eukprot:scaffold71909_cov59-Attheya_sp.AAC.1
MDRSTTSDFPPPVGWTSCGIKGGMPWMIGDSAASIVAERKCLNRVTIIGSGLGSYSSQQASVPSWMMWGTVAIVGGDGCLNGVTIIGSGLAAAVSKWCIYCHIRIRWGVSQCTLDDMGGGAAAIVGGDGCLNGVTIISSGLAAAVSKVWDFEGLYGFTLIPSGVSTATLGSGGV